MHRLLNVSEVVPEGETPARLTPDMASFRLLVMCFVREYIGRTGDSPSYGEIAAKLGSSRKHVLKAIRGLIQEGRLIRTTRQRGLRLPTMREVAVQHLRELGWRVDEDALTLGPPGLPADVPVTKRGLLTTPALDYPARRGGPTGASDGDGDGQGAQGSRAGDQRAA